MERVRVMAEARAPRSRVAAAFVRMGAECPQDIAAYGECIVARVVSDRGSVIQRGMCEPEFARLRTCLMKALEAGRLKKAR